MTKKEKEKTIKQNRIPRNFGGMFVETLTDTSVGKKGDIFYISKNDYNQYIGINVRTQQSYSFFVAHLRNPDFIKILRYC